MAVPDEGIIMALMGAELNLHVYGFGLSNDSEIKLSSFPSKPGHICKSNILHVQTRLAATFLPKTLGKLMFFRPHHRFFLPA